LQTFGYRQHATIVVNYIMCVLAGFNTWPQSTLLLNRHQLPKERA